MHTSFAQLTHAQHIYILTYNKADKKIEFDASPFITRKKQQQKSTLYEIIFVLEICVILELLLL